MIDIKAISGEIIISVPILRDAIFHEELMASDYIMLSWLSADNHELPTGAYVEYNGEQYSLLEPYAPTMQNEAEYKYTPQFHSRIAAWDKNPACIYEYLSDGKTVKSRDFDWSFVGSPADAMSIVLQSIKNETGETWEMMISDSLPASIEIQGQAASIKSTLSSIAGQCETEYWCDKQNNIIHLSKCEHGERVHLEVGNQVGVPSVTVNKNEYYTRYYALGSTRNITQGSSATGGAVNKRLTLDTNRFPHGYKDIKGHFVNGVFVSELSQGEIYSKVVIFEDIYPSSTLEIYDVRARMKYKLDNGNKVVIGGSTTNPVYDQYAIWYFKVKNFNFTSNLLIQGLPLSVHFKTGRLAGQEFELTYHSESKSERKEGDVTRFDIDEGDFEILFKESSGKVIPDLGYIVPQSGDNITLFNINMPSEYITSAQGRLADELAKYIEKEHKDSNSYEINSNPAAFYESSINLPIGQRVLFKYGDKSIEARVLMNERRLDNEAEQKIRIGSDIIKGSTKELRENVETLTSDVDVIAAYNDLSKTIQDSYGRAQASANELLARLGDMWRFDDKGNIFTDHNVYSTKEISAGGVAEAGESTGEYKMYHFKQAEPSREWRIEHYLGKMPNVKIIDSNKQLCFADVFYENVNVAIIKFLDAESGDAYLD